MRIAIDLLVAEKESDDILRFIHALLDGLMQVDEENEYIIITAHPEKYRTIAAAPNMRIYAVALRSRDGILIQRQLLLPGILQKLRVDILHVQAFFAPIGWNGPLVITIYDLAFLQISRRLSLYWQRVLRESARRAQRVIAVSEQTRNQLVRSNAVEPQRIRVIPPALHSSLQYADFSVEQVQSMQQFFGGRYLLYVGPIMPHRNVALLMQTIGLLIPHFPDLQLVMMGNMGVGSEQMLRQVEASSYRKHIHIVDPVPDEEPGLLYAGASMLVFPQESADLSIVEAMTYGAPVVISSEAASMEIAGEAAVRIDFDTEAMLAETIAQVLTDTGLRERLIRLGQRQAWHLTREACALATLQVYQEALDMAERNSSLLRPTREQSISHQEYDGEGNYGSGWVQANRHDRDSATR